MSSIYLTESPVQGLVNAGGEPIPLLGVQIRGRLQGLVCEGTVAQRFRNVETRPIEATYLFPLPEEAAICGFAITVGERVLQGQVEEREQAFRQYDEAMAQGHGAFLLDEERPNVFQVSVGNLLPGQEALVEVRFLLVARPAAEGLRLLLPTTISPRYSPAALTPEEREEVERTTPPYAAQVPYGLTCELAVEQPSGIIRITSPSHAIQEEAGAVGRVVRLATPAAALDRDLILLVETAAPRAASTLASEREGRTHLLVELYPELATPAGVSLPRHLTFVIDCSGSMMGESIAQARQAVELCLRALNPGDRFQLIRFGSTHEQLFPEVAEFGEQTLARAVQWVRSMDADLGGTEILSPLEELARGLSAEGHADVIVLTDGEVSNEDQVLELAGRHQARWRIFAFGIGAGVSEYLVRGIARNSGGQAEFISNQERIEPKVLRQFARIDTPLLAQVTLDWTRFQAEQAPAVLPPIFNGDALLVAARLPAGQRVLEGEEVVLRGLTPTGFQEWRAPVHWLTTGQAVPLWWARQAIRDLEEGVSALAARRGSRQARRSAGTDSPLVQLSRAYGLLCRDTSFVAVETRADGEKAKEQAELRRVPVQITAGWHGGGGLARTQAGVARTQAGVAYGGGSDTLASCPAPARRAAPGPRQKARTAASHLTTDQDDLAAFALPRPAPPRPAPPMPAPPMPAQALPADFFKLDEAEACDSPEPVEETGRVGRFFRSLFGKEKQAAPPAPPAASASFAAAASSGEPAPADPGLPWYLNLLLQAQADGSFPLDRELAHRCGKPLAELQEWAERLQVAGLVDREALLATALVLHLLRTRVPAEEPVWRLAAAKAERWLQGHPVTAEGLPLPEWLARQLPG